MKCDIQSRNDILTGASLIIRIPEEDLDRKALYTIQADRPEFILPFHHKYIDGQAEFVYQIGAKSKLQYLAGDRSPNEYAQLWSVLLSPLLDCGDWFMKPYSFVLDVGHIYYDKNQKIISYIYVPSIKDCSDYCDLKEMAADLSRQIPVTDADLENNVLRAIMIDFNPDSFLKMLKQYAAVNVKAETLWPVREATPPLLPGPPVVPLLLLSGANTTPFTPVFTQTEAYMPGSDMSRPDANAQGVSGDIIINLPGSGKPAKKRNESIKDITIPGGKKEKTAKKPKGMSGLGRNKKDAQIPSPGFTLVNAAVSPPKAAINSAQPPELVNNTIYPSGIVNTAIPPPGTVSNAAQQPGMVNIAVQPPGTVSNAAHPPDKDSITEDASLDKLGAWLRLVSSVSLPPVIDVPIETGEVFTIGRFDTAVGRQQSSFEFDRKTKAVSRRHAVLERCSDKYSIIDLASSAGTFLNGRKLPPNTPCELKQGCMISFGNCGADYIWEVN